MAVAGDARPRHRRVDQAAVPLRPSTRMGAQAAAIPPATPIRTDRPSRPQNDPAALTRLALGRAARRRVQASASAPTPNRLTRGASGALPDDQPRDPPGVSLPAKHPNTSAFGRKHHRDPRHAPQTPNQHPAAPSRHPQTPHRGPPGRLLQATRFRSYRKIEVGRSVVRSLPATSSPSKMTPPSPSWLSVNSGQRRGRRDTEPGMLSTDEALLDNPVYAALSGAHARFAQVCGRARRYPVDVGPFFAVPSQPSAGDWRDAAGLVAPGTYAAVLHSGAEGPPGWKTIRAFEVVQMVEERVTGVDCPQAISLGAADVPEMLELVAETEPGP